MSDHKIGRGKIPLLFFFIILTFFLSLNAGTIYETKYKYDADVIVYLTKYKYEADLIVYVSKYKYEAEDKDEIWYFSPYRYEADVKVYLTKYKYEADLVVYFTKYRYEAKWVNSSRFRGSFR